MKAIKIQIDMVYWVDDEKAHEIYERDLGFYKQLEDSFHSWSGNSQEPRNPISFDLRHIIGEYNTDEASE